jgi:hypothetical protein
MDNFLTRRTILSGASFAGLSLTSGDALAVGSQDDALPTRKNIATGAISVDQFGAIGDGQFHPLSSRFPTLSAARNSYPTATALSESLDGHAIQAAIDHAAQLGAGLQARWRVHIPAGRYRLSQSIRLPSNVNLSGDGIDVSIIDNQNTRLDAPLVVNANPDFVSMSLCDLSLHGGTHGVRINARQYVDGYEFTRVAFQMQSDKNFECNKLLQIGSFTGCVFAKAPYGIFVAEWTTNVANFFHCRFEDHSRASLHLTAAEAVNFFGGRFESGSGTTGKEATIELTRAASINFHGVYFEGTHPVLLRESQSRNGVTFAGCHFTASSKGPYQFESDGIVHFGTNDWGTLSSGPARMTVSGANAGLVGTGRRYLLRTPTDWHIHSEQASLAAGGKRPVAVLRRVGTGSGAACVTGMLHLTRMARRPDGGIMASAASYQLTATSSDGRVMAVEVAHTSGEATPLRVVPSPVSRDGATLIASAVDGLGGVLRWRIEAQAIATQPDNRIELDIE